jgi:hypothetical protein
MNALVVLVGRLVERSGDSRRVLGRSSCGVVVVELWGGRVVGWS